MRNDKGEIVKQMRRIYKSILAVAVIAVMGILFGAPTASALDSGTSITISPLVARPEIAASQTTSGKFTIVNNGSVDYEFQVYARPYTVDNGSYAQEFTNENAPRAQLYRWISFDQENYALKSGEQVEVSYHVETPKSIPAGSQYAVIFAQTRLPESGEEGIQSSQRVGIVLLAKNKGGKTINDGKVTKFSLGRDGKKDGENAVLDSKNPWYRKSPIYGITYVENKGNTDFELTSVSKLTSIFSGREIAKTESAPRAIFPDTNYRSVNQVGCGKSDDENAKKSDNNNSCDNLPWIGLYRLTTEAQALGKTYTYKRLILIMPLWFIIASATVLLSIIFLVARKMHISRKSKKMNSKNKTLDNLNIKNKANKNAKDR